MVIENKNAVVHVCMCEKRIKRADIAWLGGDESKVFWGFLAVHCDCYVRGWKDRKKNEWTHVMCHKCFDTICLSLISERPHPSTGAHRHRIALKTNIIIFHTHSSRTLSLLRMLYTCLRNNAHDFYMPRRQRRRSHQEQNRNWWNETSLCA